MPLTMMKAGELVTVREIRGKDEVRRFLGNLGITAGGLISVVSRLDGNLIIRVKDARIALSSAMASRIMV